MMSVRTTLLLALLAAIPGSIDGATDSATHATRVTVATTGCEPAGPLAITLTGRENIDGLVELDYTLTPRFDGSWMGLAIELPHGGRVRVHDAPASVAWLRGEARVGHALIELPDSARRGEHAAEVRVVAHLGLAQPDGSVDRIGSDATIVLGSGPLPVAGRLVTSGALTTWDVASRHTGGAR